MLNKWLIVYLLMTKNDFDLIRLEENKLHFTYSLILVTKILILSTLISIITDRPLLIPTVNIKCVVLWIYGHLIQ